MNMGQLSLAVITVLALMRTANGNVALFDCNRPSQKCEDGATCDPNTKLCTGCKTKFGYACQTAVADATDVKDCQNAPCQNGGTCLAGGGCRCTPAFTGPTCSKETLLLTCAGAPPGDSDAMTLDVSALIGAGNSQVTVDGAKNSDAADARCFGTTLGKLTIVNVDAAKTATCPDAKKTPVTGGNIYTRTFLIRFSDGMTSISTDFKVTAQCGPAGSTIDIQGTSFTANADTTNLPVRDVGQTVAGAKLATALTIGGNPLVAGQPYQLTDTIKVTITLDTTNSVFAAIRLEMFKVDNKATTPTSLELIKNACPTANSKVVMKTLPSRPSENEIVFETVPVLIDPTEINFYTGVVLVCRTLETDKCKPVNCGAGTGLGRRRKREADSDTATMSVGFNVRDQSIYQKDVSQIKDELNNETVCVLSSEMTATLVAMAIAILLLLVLVIVLIVRAIITYHRDVTVYQHHPLQDASSTCSLPKLVNTSY